MHLRAETILLLGLILGCAVIPKCLTPLKSAQVSTLPTAPIPPPGDPQRLRDEIKAVENLLPNLTDQGAALFLLAHHYARLGDPAKALNLLKECVALDEGFDPSDEPAFASLKSNPEFRQLIEAVRHRYPAVHQAHLAFTLTQNDLFPEGLAVNTTQRNFYMGSMHHNEIVRITEAGAISDFVKEGIYDLMPVGGVHIDPADQSVWCATDPGEKNRSEIVHFDLSGKLIEHYAAPGVGPHDLNDLVLRNSMEIYTTDTFANRVFSFDRKTRTFSPLNLSAGKHGRPLFYPNGITLSQNGNELYVADFLGIVRFDLRTNEVDDVKPAPHDTLAGVDGLYWYEGGLVGIQNGTGANRVVRWQLSSDGSRVTSTTVLERGTELVNDPTTGAILDGKLYFIANTGIANLDDNGKIVDPARLEPLHIAVVPLK